jgi:hypothetical protein
MSGATWPPADVEARIAAEFPHAPPAAILALLEGYGGTEKSRVARCILHLARGDTDRLRELVASANTDSRDVIYWAEYDRDGRRVREFDRPFEDAASRPRDGALSFIGGHPVLPPGVDIPTCAACSARMCFFFQVALPAGHRWAHSILAMFHCTSCCSEETLVPEMPDVALEGADIPPGFLATYQTNFRFVVAGMAGASRRADYEPLIEHDSVSPSSWRVGAEPEWLLDDEAPGSYESFRDPAFLFQVPRGTIFATRPGAPPQKTLDLEGAVVDADRAHYELFLGNAAYFFGFGPPAAERIYVVTQAD